MTKQEIYGMMGDGMTLPITSTDLNMLFKEADKCNGIILTCKGEIVYVGGESKVLAKLK